ncbi:MAG TPA: hypothetical protein VG672_16240, partial [Bryobacteraceae bacterium]|nr:hypothetical protein [Bryobacteraceae bacterium]
RLGRAVFSSTAFQSMPVEDAARARAPSHNLGYARRSVNLIRHHGSRVEPASPRRDDFCH